MTAAGAANSTVLAQQRSRALHVLSDLVDVTPLDHPQAARRTLTLLAAVTESASSEPSAEFVTTALDVLEDVVQAAWSPSYSSTATGLQVVVQRQLLPSAFAAGVDAIGNTAKAVARQQAEAEGGGEPRNDSSEGERTEAVLRLLTNAAMGASLPGEAPLQVIDDASGVAVRAQRLLVRRLPGANAAVAVGNSSVALPDGFSAEDALAGHGWVDFHLVQWSSNQFTTATASGHTIGSAVTAASFVDNGTVCACVGGAVGCCTVGLLTTTLPRGVQEEARCRWTTCHLPW